MAVLAVGYEVTANDVSTFKDTPAIDPADPLYPSSYVAVAAKNHIIEGYLQDNTFRFWNIITREQAITIVVRAAGSALAAPPANYKGVLSYSEPDHGANIRKAEYNGLLTGIPDLANWDTNQSATRGEGAEMLAQLFYRTGKMLSVTGPSGTQDFTMGPAQCDAIDHWLWRLEEQGRNHNRTETVQRGIGSEPFGLGGRRDFGQSSGVGRL
jgi:hypothetical protein